MNREETTELIERYLDGELPEDERLSFELRLESDRELAAEFELHLQVRRSFTWNLERNKLKGLMDQYHQEFSKDQIPFKEKKNNGGISIRRMALVAASVSLLVTAGALVVYNMIQKNEIDRDHYATLNRRETPVVAAAPEVTPKEESQAEETPAPSVNVATAFALDSDGTMLTNYHVVAGKKYVYVEKFQDSLQRYVAEVVDFDRRLDVAVIRITDPEFKKLKTLPYSFAPADAMIGQKVFTLGYPKKEIVYSEGPVSSLTGYHSDTIALQLSLAVNPGNSGAPVFSESGELIGVITGKNTNADGEAFSVKAEHVRGFLEHSDKIKIKLPNSGKLRGKKVTEQVKALDPFIFIVKA